MFDFGFSELLLIGVVALVVLGPERLPQVARTAGFWLGKVRTYVDSVKSELNRQVEAAELREVKESMESAAKSFQESVQDINRSAKSELDTLSDELDLRPAWGRLPRQKTPADFGVDEQGRPLESRETDTAFPESEDLYAFDFPDFSDSETPLLHMVSLRRQAMMRQRDMRPKYRARPKLRVRGRR